jgi:hypothetical protein
MKVFGGEECLDEEKEEREEAWEKGVLCLREEMTERGGG